jgi:phosphatidylglycerol:prolipoprotein diacylglycerol transferase
VGVGRIGNFIDGQILGAVTDVWWAVKFPYAEGFRHPVTLYDSLKNFLMIPFLLAVRRASPPGRGMLLAHFVFWYGFGRFFVDLFREYPTTFFGVGTGQYFNSIMALSGLMLIGCFTFMNRWLRFSSLERGRLGTASTPEGGCVELGPWDLTPTVSPVTLWPKRFLFILLVLFPLIIPTDWTQGNIKQGPAVETTGTSEAFPPRR